MSVINKMLRDLDHRQVQPDVPGTADALRQQGVASVPSAAPATRRGVRLLALLLLLLVATGAAGWWWLNMQTPDATPLPPPVVVSVAPATPPAPPASEVVMAPTPVVQEVVEMPPPAPSIAMASPGLRMETALANSPPPPVETASAVPPKAAMAPPTKTATTVVPAPQVAEPPKKPPSPSPALAAPTSTAVVPLLPAADTANLAQRQQQAARETLAQAQALWNSGARDNAITLLQDAVAAAERTAQTAPSAANSQTLVSMLRELARMELAEGRAGAVWDLLTRLEPVLANQPELWAMRANAAQRLGRHQDSVQAYTTALQSRPGEQRWLLGAAVSLAALGQTSAAAEMADKARAVGPVSKEVQIYLRQQGVPLADR